MMDQHQQHHHEGGNHHNNNNMESSSTLSSCLRHVRRLRLRRIFLGLMALGYTAISIAIYRSILMLVHSRTDFLNDGILQQQTYYWIALSPPTTDEDFDNHGAVVTVVNASHDDDDDANIWKNVGQTIASPNTTNTFVPEVPLRNDSVTLTSITTPTTTTNTITSDIQSQSNTLIPTTEILQQNASAQAETTQKKKKKKKTAIKFFMLKIPELTTDLVQQHWDKAYVYGEKGAAMNEDLAEIWLHRGLSNFTYEQGQTMDPSEADVFFIPAYLHGRDSWIRPTATNQNHRKDIVTAVMNALIDKTKPHVLLIPTRDKTLGTRIGYRLVAETLWDQGRDNNNENKNSSTIPFPLYSVGFERNSWWQVIPTDRIIPIPYVVKPQVSANEMPIVMFEQANRTENFVFYAAHPRPSAVSFAGCNRSTVLPLQGQENMEILLLLQNDQRLSQERYNHRMLTSDYCLVTCGDTPTSRSLASAMVAGCIPLRIGSWWRAICEAPCKKIHIGFNVAIKPHFPFANEINWSLFPEMNQLQFDENPKATLSALIQNTTRAQKDAMRTEMKRVQSSWIYGWGNPINSTTFGNVYKYLWNSIIHELEL